ncbi:LexA family protein [Gilliamella apicola]|uniref:DNA-binding protein n=1 Tax=Gilliamella apicola TaxID=1196095 RepID=A0A242NK13_9GAMM|nr:S24 family peptidase [Gilliamella apicola]OTP83223.1 DNA-binding protein [Gilliamella apicola]OTP84639.1 DNA-binding protein [Gilliamella apicola]OTQ00782.1 DNA-binding protein [Gilliamella apicola]OTQ11110.1 DNA-binding protein [Gilliamella apicola]OTQ12772.1 DNA-binding protein [Gilliamella apicola]
MATETIGQRIRRRRKTLNLTQKDLAKSLQDASHGSISQWESDITSPSAKNLFDLSIALECDFAWLLNGGEETNVVPASLKSFKVPLISYVQAGVWTESCELRDSTGFEYIMTSLELSDKAFALQIKGDSMEPEFKEGDVVIIDPAIKPIPGEFVVAMNGESEATFKKYRELGYDEHERMQFELIPLNSDYTTMSTLKQQIRIVGTMVEHRIFRRKR